MSTCSTARSKRTSASAGPDATDAEVRAAASLARVDEIAERLPEGWEARVGEAGARLSGGERQRVSIARSILKDSPIVLLDEATAALDPINERAVQQALQALTHDKTLVVVAHRLQTVQAADQILVLDEGRIVERGSHADLLELGGRYAAFWQERIRAAGWRVTANLPPTHVGQRRGGLTGTETLRHSDGHPAH